MDYSVYRASYKTVKGTWRDYLGYTPALDLRLWWHKNKPPAWMRCRGSEITLTVVENGLATKAEALACEALHAARAVTRSPLVARGGPWVRPTPPEGALEEAAAVAKCSSFGALFAQAKATPLSPERPRGAIASGVSIQTSETGHPMVFCTPRSRLCRHGRHHLHQP